MNAMSALNKPVDNRIVVISFIFLICATLLAITFFSIKMTYDINEKIAENVSTMTELKQEIAYLRSIQAREAQMNMVLDQANTKIPPHPDEAGIIEFIEKITENGKLTGITFGKRVDVDVAMEMPFTVTAVSTYNTMMSVLYELATAERYYSVTSININKTIDGELSYTINVSAYYATESASVSASSSAPA